MIELVYLNGSLIPKSEAKISVLDYGFLFGYGLYETMRCYAGRLFRLDSHLSRLDRSARELGMDLDIRAIRRGALDVVKANNFPDMRVRITVSIGEGTMTPNLASCGKPTVLVIAGEYHPFPPKKYAQGFNVIISSVRKNSRSPVTFVKSTSSMENMMARREARDAGADECLFLNERGCVTEASGSNVFLVESGTIRTPRVKSGILPGVTRAAVFELATRNGLDILETDIRLDQLYVADEAFLTNSLIEVMPLASINGKRIGKGAVGPKTAALTSAYRELVLSELHGQ